MCKDWSLIGKNWLFNQSSAFCNGKLAVQGLLLLLQVLSADVGEDAESHAAKLLEVILLQCRGQVDNVRSLPQHLSRRG